MQHIYLMADTGNAPPPLHTHTQPHCMPPKGSGPGARAQRGASPPDELLQKGCAQAPRCRGGAAHHWPQLLRVAAQHQLPLGGHQRERDERLGRQCLRAGVRGGGMGVEREAKNGPLHSTRATFHHTSPRPNSTLPHLSSLVDKDVVEVEHTPPECIHVVPLSQQPCSSAAAHDHLQQARAHSAKAAAAETARHWAAPAVRQVRPGLSVAS
jgi:hypothetical protein